MTYFKPSAPHRRQPARRRPSSFLDLRESNMSPAHGQCRWALLAVLLTAMTVCGSIVPLTSLSEADRSLTALSQRPGPLLVFVFDSSIEEEAEAELVLAAAVRDLSETPSSTGDRLTVLTVDVNLAASIAWLKAEAPGLDYQKQVSLNTLKQRRHGNGKPAWVGYYTMTRDALFRFMQRRMQAHVAAAGTSSDAPAAAAAAATAPGGGDDGASASFSCTDDQHRLGGQRSSSCSGGSGSGSGSGSTKPSVANTGAAAAAAASATPAVPAVPMPFHPVLDAPLDPKLPKFADSVTSIFGTFIVYRRVHDLARSFRDAFRRATAASVTATATGTDIAAPSAAGDRASAVAECRRLAAAAQQWALDVRAAAFGHLFSNQTHAFRSILHAAMQRLTTANVPTAHAPATAVATSVNGADSDANDYFIVERARVRRQLDAAADRERRVGAATADQRQRRAVLGFRHEMLRNFYEPIPRTVHFIKCDESRDHFLFVHYLSIRSASVHIKPDVIKFHCVVEPRGFYWSRLRAETPELVVVIGQRPTMMGDKPLPLRGNGAVFPAHVSDVWRMQILLAEGGIYLDWDVIVTRSFDSLLHNGVVFGAEKKVEPYQLGLGVAVMMARPREPFMVRYNELMGKYFEPAKCYACHTIQLARFLSEHHSGELHVLDHYSFYHPGWEKEAARMLFEPLPPGTKPNRFSETFAIHLFESHENMVPHMHALNERSIFEVDNNFNHLVRKLWRRDAK